MTIDYLSNIGFTYNSSTIKWNEDRNSIRKIFGNKHREDDRTINVSEFYNGDESMNINQRRDVYENLNSKSDLLFLNYNQHNRLTELEVHFGYDILINNIKLEFGKEITEFIKLFGNSKIEYSETETGNYILPKLKIAIANDEAMGGNGNGLSYFYGTSDISHLTE